MASVHNRPGRPLPWEAKWRDPETARLRSKSFRRKGDAARHGVRMEASKLDGTYVGVAGSRTTFRTYAEEWRSSQVHRVGTADQVEGNLARHVYPRLGHRPLAAIRPSEVQALVKAMTATLAPATVAVIHAWVSSVFKAAVADRLIASSPCTGAKLPPVERPKVAPLELGTVAALADAIDPRYRAAGRARRRHRRAHLRGPGADRRPGRLPAPHRPRRPPAGARPGRVPVFGPVKDRKNRPRTIPVGSIVLDELAAHMAAYGTGAEGLLFTNALGDKVGHTTWSNTWLAAACPLGIDKGDGFHQLRHFYASTLIGAGASVKEVQERLGHASAAMTLDVYSHLWPADDDRTRAVTDKALAALASSCSPDVRQDEG